MSHHVFRFAPSPNGYLHLGHAYSAILNHDMAKACNGRFLLRIEDIDTTRCTDAYEQSIYNDLTWLGLIWEQPVRRQSEHFYDYTEALKQLKGLGLIYPSFLSRKDITEKVDLLGSSWPRDPDGAPHYPGTERDLSADAIEAALRNGDSPTWRLNMAKAIAQLNHPLTWQETGFGRPQTIQADPAAWGDVIIARKHTPTSYHLSVVVDDALQGVTQIVRGRDLYQATSVHRLLQVLLNLPEPRYHHHALINDENGTKLSKSVRSKSLHQMRMEGLDSAQVRQLVRLHSGKDCF